MRNERAQAIVRAIGKPVFILCLGLHACSAWGADAGWMAFALAALVWFLCEDVVAAIKEGRE